MNTIVYIILVLSFIFHSLLSVSKSDILGFSVDLIHRDSHASPFYNPSLTHFERVHNALRHSHERLKHFISASRKAKSFSTGLVSDGGGLIMKVALGTPPFTTFLGVDTRCDLIWTQCKPCKRCFKQKDLLFEPNKSSTYKVYPCDSRTCRETWPRFPLCADNRCAYLLEYSDGSSIDGLLASETFTLGLNSTQNVSFSGITFGCGFDSEGRFNENLSGLIGLGAGPNSFISQIDLSINGMFSYCLTQGFKEPLTGKINFGNNAVLSGSGITSTPLSISDFYWLNLEALSVGNRRVELVISSVEDGNIIIDSGTTMTYLHYSTYNEFVGLVREAMGNKTVPDPSKPLDLCYRISDKPSYPKITAYFTNASVDLELMNAFIQLDDDVSCLAFLPSDDELQIYGNVAQTNFLVGYDTWKGTVSFQPYKCGHISS